MLQRIRWDEGGMNRSTLLSVHRLRTLVCTVVLAWQVFEHTPIALAANRDEYLSRPSEQPRRRDWEQPVIAPLDRKAGGTWFGYNQHELVVTITNRWRDGDVDADRSRGLLVRDALGCESAIEAAQVVERELDVRIYDGFHLLLVDETAAILVTWDGVRDVQTLGPGVHLVVNVGVNGSYVVPSEYERAGNQQAASAEKISAALVPEPGELANSWLDRAGSVLSDHEYGACLHRGEFGTKSSTLFGLGDDVTYRFAPGPPCENDYESVEETF